MITEEQIKHAEKVKERLERYQNYFEKKVKTCALRLLNVQRCLQLESPKGFLSNICPDCEKSIDKVYCWFDYHRHYVYYWKCSCDYDFAERLRDDSFRTLKVQLGSSVKKLENYE